MQKLYAAIKDDLLARLEDGTYPVGSTLPTETELAQIYGVSRPTVREALGLLADAGYLEKRRRRGTVVCDPGVLVVSLGDGTQLLRDADARPSLPARRVRTVPIYGRTMPATPEVAAGLGIREKDEVHKLVRLRYVDGIPNVFMVNHIPAKAYPALLDADFSATRLYDRMRELGRPVATATRRVEAVPADSLAAALFDVTPGDVVYRFRITGRDRSGLVVEWSDCTYRSFDDNAEGRP